MLTDRATLCKDFSVKFGGNDGNFTIYKVFFSGTRQSDPIQPIVGTDMINPRRTCAARVTVLALFVCVCVCLSVTTLAATAFVSACNQRHLRHCIEAREKAFRSKVNRTLSGPTKHRNYLKQSDLASTSAARVKRESSTATTASYLRACANFHPRMRFILQRMYIPCARTWNYGGALCTGQ